MITGLIDLFLFDSPFSPPGHPYLLSPPSLLYLTLWISLGVLGCGEHLGKWLLAKLVSPLSTSPLLFLVTYLYLPPPSSPCNSVNLSGCPLLWRILSPIKLDVLSSVLYGWRSLEAIVRIRLKARGRRLKSKTWEHQRTPDSREH